MYTQDGKLAFAVDSKKGGGSSFVYLAGQRVAEDHWLCPDTHTVTYFHSDVLGSPVATTNASATVLERTYYAPYGEALNRTVDGPGYTGHVQDAATGLVYAQQRYYDPVVGRFLSIDPVAADAGTGGTLIGIGMPMITRISIRIRMGGSRPVSAQMGVQFLQE